MAAGAAAGDVAGAATAGGSETSEPRAIDAGSGGGSDDAAFVPVDVAPLADVSAGAQAQGDPPAFLVGRPARPTPTPAWDEDEAWRMEPGTDVDPGEGEPVRIPVAAPRRMPVGYAPVAPGKGERKSGGSRQGRVDASGPSWEQPRHFEEYPTLKSPGRAGIPRVAIYALVVLLVGAGLFAAPFIFKGMGGGGDQASPTPASSASAVPSAETSPTAVPTPDQVVHVVKSGDTISKIAALYGVTIDDILAANPTITDPNKIAVGDKIVIPQPLPSEIVDVEITPAP